MSAADVIAQLLVTLAFMGLGLAGWYALAPAGRRECPACGATLPHHRPWCPNRAGGRDAPR